jgi:hypothetical protein
MTGTDSEIHDLFTKIYFHVKKEKQYCPICIKFGEFHELIECDQEGYMKHVSSYDHNSPDGIFTKFVETGKIYQCPGCNEKFNSKDYV